MNFIQYLKSKYPEGSIQYQCGDFAHRLADFGSVGDSYSQKKAYVNANGIIMANIAEIGRGFRVGDVLVTSEGTWMGLGNGHVAFCIEVRNGNPIVVESNFKKDFLVHYGRVVPLNKIYGIIRAPLKIDLGQVEINFSVLINNQKWNVGFLDDLQKHILRITNNKLKINFFPVLSKCENWEYETIIFPIIGGECRVIKKSYMDSHVKPIANTTDNKPADAFIFVVRPNQWEGTSTFGQELAYTNGRQIQASCAEFDTSPFYYGMKLASHIIIHELSHTLHDINGMNDTTHIFDNQNRDLDNIFKDLDWNRIKCNL